MTSRCVRSLLALAAISTIATTAPAVPGPTKLLRFPDVHGDQVAFCYAGDIWKASIKGGTAVRLTAHPGVEVFPRFSPDGQWIAFTGQYDGDEQVYVMPADGGTPSKLTYYPAEGPLPPRWGYDNIVYGWTPDGKSILFRSLRYGYPEHPGQLYTVSKDGGPATPLPMPRAGAGDFSADGKKLVYSPLWRDFRTWKRYQGGWAQDLYIYDLATNAAKPVAPSKRTERDPMWIGDAIYFVSDRTGTLNLFKYDLRSEAVSQVTKSDTWDIRWASSDGAKTIVFEKAGELVAYDVRAGKESSIPHHGPRRWALEPAVSRCRGQQHRGLRPVPQGRARSVRGARRHLHGTDRERPHAQRDALLRSPRSSAGMVARRKADRLHFRRFRRRRALSGPARWSLGRQALDQGERGSPVRPHLGAGRQAHRLLRQRRPDLRDRRCRRQTGRGCERA
jgi:hypothetical protein